MLHFKPLSAFWCWRHLQRSQKQGESRENKLSYIIIQRVRCCYQPWQINNHYPFQSGALLSSKDERVSGRKLRGTKSL